MMVERTLNEGTITRLAAKAGIASAEITSAQRDEAITQQLSDTRRLAEALRIEGTPAFIVGDRLIPGADVAALKAAIQEARTGQMKRPG
jgi:protein-disulfide isomerase